MCSSHEKERAAVWHSVSLFPKLLSLLALTDQKADHCQLAKDVTIYFTELKSKYPLGAFTWF